MACFPTSKLKEAVGTVRAAVSSRTPRPVLLHTLLANGTLTASDLEIQIAAPIDYGGEPILLPYEKISAILNNTSGDEVEVNKRGTHCLITTGGGSWRLPTVSAEDFPSWESVGLKRIASVPPEKFTKAVSSTAYAAADDVYPQYATGSVLIERRGTEISFVAADNRRASAFSFAVDDDPNDSDALLPKRAALAMASIASRVGEPVTIDASSSEVVVACGGVVLKSRLTGGGRFPKWREWFQHRDAPRSLVMPLRLLTATLQAGIVTSETSSAVQYSISQGGMRLSARSSESGESMVECPLERAGTSASVDLRPSAVADIARSVDPDLPLEIDVFDSESRVVFRSGETAAVVMPVCKN